jgi:hypothetical protein
MEDQRELSVPEAARYLLSEERMERFVELYRRATKSGDERAVAAADEALRHFQDAEAALTRMMANETAVTKFLGEPGPYESLKLNR